MKFKLIVLASLLCFQLAAQDCLPDWTYYREIEIQNGGPEDLTDHQVRLDINTGMMVTDGKLNADGSDLRFTMEDCTLLPYFMDSLATSNDNRVWIKIPSIPASSTITIRAYYGNTDASPYADGDATFVFFDDFSSETVDLAKWEPVGSYATLEVIDGVLNYASDGENPGPRFKFVRTAMNFSEPMIFEFAAEITNSNGFGFSNGDIDIERILFRQAGFGFDTLNQVAFMQDTFDNGYQVEGFYPLIRWPRYEMQSGAIQAGINGSDYLETTFFGNTSIGSISTDTYTLESTYMTSFHFIVSSFLSAQTVYLDYLRVRKPTDFPPSSMVGPEMMNPMPTGIATLLPAGSISMFPNPTIGILQIESQLDEEVEVWVVNTLGQSTSLGVINLTEQNTVDLSNFSNGVYQLVFKQSSDQTLLYTTKVMVQR